MCPKYYRQHATTPKSTQRGSMLVIALFVIIVLALLGLTMTRLLSSSSETIIYEVLGQRALNAARAGMEEQITLVFPIDPNTDGDDNPLTDPPAAQCSAVNVFRDFSVAGSTVAGLENCLVNASCTEIDIGGNSAPPTYFKLTSTGQCGAGGIRVSRSINVDALR